MQADASSSSPTASSVLPPARRWMAMAGVGMGVFMGTLDGSIVNVALPTLVRELGTSFAVVQWVVISYLVVVTGMMLGVARLGDMIGKRRVYLTGILVFVLGSLLCGLSPGVGALIAARALQGFGASMMTSMGAAILTEVFPSQERGKALGAIGSVVSLGIAVGPSLGGVLIGSLGWRWIFLVNVPIGLLTTVIIARVIPVSRPAEGKQRFDWAGAGLAVLGLLSYATGMTVGQAKGFSSPQAIGLFVIGFATLGVFIAVEWRVKQPMLDLTIFRSPLLSINLLMAMLVFVVVAGQALLMPFFLELVRGYSHERVGLLLVTVPACLAISSPLSGMLSDRFGSRGISLLGLCLAVIGCLSVSTLGAEGSGLDYVIRVIPTGIGFGMFQAPNNSAIMGAIPKDKLGIGSGLLSLSRTLGQSTGIPLIGAIFAAHVAASSGGAVVTTAPKAVLVVSLASTFRLAACILALSALLALLAWRLDKRAEALAPALCKLLAAPRGLLPAWDNRKGAAHGLPSR